MISVCIPTYNGSKYIGEQLKSILSQLSENDEVIISDDSSTDDTIKIIKELNDTRIIIYDNNSFKSPIYNLENALKHSRGDYIFLADQDDVWEDCKVEKVMKQFNIYDCIVTDATVVDKDLNVITDSFFVQNNSKKGLFHNVIKIGYLGCCMAFNRKILEKSLPFPSKLPMHDSWIGFVAEKYGKVLFLDEKLLKYRRHGENASPTSEKSKRSFISKISDRVHLVFYLILR